MQDCRQQKFYTHKNKKSGITIKKYIQTSTLLNRLHTHLQLSYIDTLHSTVIVCSIYRIESSVHQTASEKAVQVIMRAKNIEQFDL